MITLCLCVPEPETLENGVAPTDTVLLDEDVPVVSATAPQPEDKDITKLEFEGQVHPGVEGARTRSSSGSSYDSDGEKNEGTYTSPDYADKYKDEEEQRPDDLSPVEEKIDPERERYASQPDDVQGYDEPDKQDRDAFPGETDLDAAPENNETVETNLDDVVADDKDRPDENFNMAPRSPKRKYESSSESEQEEEPDRDNENDDAKRDADEVGKETQKPEDEEPRVDEGADDDAEKRSRSSSSSDDEKFDKLKDDIDQTRDEDKDKPGETSL